MTTTRRAVLAGAAALLAAPAALRAQEGPYPSRPVTVVVPWAAGGSTDAFARLLAQRLSADLGQGFVVDNRTGANGTIGLASAARARPDGYTVIVLPNSTYAVAPHLYPLGFTVEQAFAGVGLLVSMPMFMLVGRATPVTTLAEYVALAKRPGMKPTYANAGIGATSHLATEMLLQAAGIEVADIGYRGGGPAIQAVVAGEAGMLCMPAAGVMGLMASGDLRALAVASPQRTPLAPEVPTFAEQGYPQVEIIEHIAMLAPAGTPQPILETLNAACRKALTAPDMTPAIEKQVVTAEARPLAEWPSYLAAESRKMAEIVRARNIRVQ
ncbi:Bug family tripartite tricarboxylate transporter substrate binding protein [Paracraurococcus lichenis]|uniref:Tripartite tricarboxylate transporter substrate binding protein n=1 Tax=Paracraurococcus lichenis TaxID=3064888 RepID=A0ABT9DWB5_9PROT|nr:tripartite tricarboxylate transporter substrate binding protein [Paracraurococcus sp. LOR1-02]MDO9708090.1 tripartite tricarboxylate transporter substrate binding protein [Paracraurococcus sp. LOR1-02]